MIDVKRFRIMTAGQSYIKVDPLGNFVEYDTYVRNMEHMQKRIRELEIVVKSLEDDIEAIYDGEAGYL